MPQTEALVYRMPWAKDSPEGLGKLLRQEWLVTNGLGGYASGTVAGAATRRFHGLLIAALPSPLGRIMMLNHVEEEIRTAERRLVRLTGEGSLEENGVAGQAGLLSEFRLESGFPTWRYETDGIVLEKTVIMPHMQNTVFIRYRMLSGEGPVRLHMRPAVNFRHHEGRVDQPLLHPHRLWVFGKRYLLHEEGDMPDLRILVYGQDASFVLDGGSFREINYQVEASRGYDAKGRLWSPGYLRAELMPGMEATLAASTEPWEIFSALTPQDAHEIELQRRSRLISLARPEARERPAGDWVLAADQFVITPNTRVPDAARIRALGDDVRTVIAGYHWFTDWGRDTMISLEGLTLITGRFAEAGFILRMFSRHIKDGLIPNMFPEGQNEGLYHTADATLWFFHALDRYLEYSKDRSTLNLLMPKLEDIITRHLQGTKFGIKADPADGLLSQGEKGYQLTWMDAKVDDWVVTPRQGKAVEINALWYNALRLMEKWKRQDNGQEAARQYQHHADRAYASFNARFWNQKDGWLYDVIDGDPEDMNCLRPNQIFAFSLPHPVLMPERWPAVLETVRRELLTPIGLRTLARGHKNYSPTYSGDLRARDAAYHQGTVWAWLIGPFVDAWLRVYPADKSARRFIEGFVSHLNEGALGSISEIFDADEPYTPRGCVAQAWSVAEVLRSWVKTAD